MPIARGERKRARARAGLITARNLSSVRSTVAARRVGFWCDMGGGQEGMAGNRY
jgi:hypothetical protein